MNDATTPSPYPPFTGSNIWAVPVLPPTRYPLIFAFGAGAEAREVLGCIIVGGLGLATIATLYLTPVAYLLLAGLSKPKATEAARLRRELAEAASPQARPAE